MVLRHRRGQRRDSIPAHRQNELAAVDACRELGAAQNQYFAHPPANLPNQFAQKLVATKAGTMVCTGTVPAMSSIAQSTPSSLRTPKSPNGPSWRACSFQWLYVSDTHEPRTTCAGRRQELHRRWHDEQRIRFRRLPCGAPLLGCDDFYCRRIRNHFRKDLGSNTTKLAQAMTVYDPDSSWHRVE